MANPKQIRKRIIFLVGPTAVGKSEAALKLAARIPAEIISCDSMQIYKGMDIVSSKPLKTLMRRVKHHLIGILSPEEEYSVVKYRRQAIDKIKEVIKRGRIPLFVGGTGFYMSILIDGIFTAKPENKKLRQFMYKEAELRGSRYLHQKLAKVDPQAALRIHPNDTRRIVRALEVFETMGLPISKLQKHRRGLACEYDIRIFCLNMPRDKLYKRIDERVDKMFKRGLLKEISKLLKLKLSRTACYCLGIRELKGYFRGLYDLEEAKRLMKRNSRLYAKRQLTWLRKDKRINWIELSGRETPQLIANKIWKKLF